MSLVLRAAIRACRTHEKMHVTVDQELLIAAAKANGVIFETVQEIKADTEKILAIVKDQAFTTADRRSC